MRAVSTSSDDDMGRVQSIHRYPVKSCGGETLDEIGLTRLSPLPGDRRYLWVDAKGKFLTQRPYESRQGNDGYGIPALATISASYSPDGATLRLEAPEGGEPLIVSAESGEARRKVTLFSGSARVVDQAVGAAGEWFRGFCGVAGACLVKSDEEVATTLADDWRESRRQFQAGAFVGEEGAARPIPLDDGGTILLVSQARGMRDLPFELPQSAPDLPPIPRPPRAPPRRAGVARRAQQAADRGRTATGAPPPWGASRRPARRADVLPPPPPAPSCAAAMRACAWPPCR
jgi:hypothetical protein